MAITKKLKLSAVLTFFICLFAALPSLGQEKPYIIGSGDVLSVIIFAGGKTQESLELTVSSEGSVNFPFLGKAKAEGLSITQFTETVTKPLARDYFVDPQVIVNVKDYRSKRVYITGAINDPGLYTLESPTTILELIAKAGGVTDERGHYAYILKGSIEKLHGKDIDQLVDQEKSVHVNLRKLLDQGSTEENVELQPGDVVYFPPTRFSDLTHYKIYVLGKVNRPGVYNFQEGLTALDACILAGGFARYAAPNRTVITRREGGKKQETITINLDRVRKGDAKDILLKPGDRIYVPKSWL